MSLETFAIGLATLGIVAVIVVLMTLPSDGKEDEDH